MNSGKIAMGVLWASGLITLAILVIVIGHILLNGMGMISIEFLLDSPRALGREGGIFPTIIGTIALVVVALVIATPIGVGGAIYLAEYTHRGTITKIIRAGAECLAGIPSILFGLFGFAFFVIFLGFGWSILSGGLTVACMILPMILRTTEEALKAVPNSYREGSLSLGATKWQTIQNVVLKSAAAGIFTGIILGAGKVAGETAAIMLTAGSALRLPTSLFDSVRPMSFHLYILAMEGLSMERAYGTAAVLVLTVLFINLTANLIMRYYTRALRG
ncbi:MAG: phosphate ABC transporter permease PstA [Methanosarcinales archaeon Met12]|nr:MAG: phosphate ABC transporter permease PstA [Methanosarcinales archaeon Met12]